MEVTLEGVDRAWHEGGQKSESHKLLTTTLPSRITRNPFIIDG